MSDEPPIQEPLAFQLFTEIGIIDQLAGHAFELALPGAITRAQFTVLHHLVRRGAAGQSPAQLADAIQVRRSTMTSTLGRLSRARLVDVRPDPHDGRGKLVVLTPAGRAMRDACIAAVGPLLPLAGRALDPAEIEQLLESLRRLRIVLDAARGP
jgi:DNA-binding MarR family transcriptional regulator